MIQCRSCKFWVRVHNRNAGFGTCRRYAAHPRSQPEESLSTTDEFFLVAWPATEGNDGCGDGRSK